MKESFGIFIILTLFSLSLYATDKLASFALEDQFKKIHSEKEFLGEKFIMIGGNTDNVELHKNFIKALTNNTPAELAQQIKIVNVFNMKEIPSLLKFYARSKFPKEEKKWMLLDWKGELAQRYSFQENGLNVLVFDKKGLVIYRCFEVDINDEQIRKIVTVIKDKK